MNNDIDKLLEYVTNNTDDIVEKINDPEMEAIMNVLSELMEEGIVESFIEDGIVKYRLIDEVDEDDDVFDDLLAKLDAIGDEDDEEGYYTSDEDWITLWQTTINNILKELKAKPFKSLEEVPIREVRIT